MIDKLNDDSIIVIRIYGRYKWRCCIMEMVSVSPKFQIVIPKSIRNKYNIKAGEKVILIPYEGRIEIIRQKDIRKMKGIFKGRTLKFEREDGRI